MIKKQFALILILCSLASTDSAQSASKNSPRSDSTNLVLSVSPSLAQDYTIYDWEDVQTSSYDTIYAISFKKSKLTELPIYLSKFTKLRYLDLSKNKLSELPSYVNLFDSLEVLILTKNKFSSFPIQICQFSALKELKIGSNDIASLPDCIEYVSKLEYLDLYDNPIGHLPQSMMRMENLQKIDFTGIRFSKDFQKRWTEQLPNTELVFDSACDCMN